MKTLKNLHFWISFIASMVVGFAVIGFAFLVSNNFTLLGWLDAVLFATAMLFALGWILIISSGGFFDAIIYGTKSFGLSFFGRKPAKSYYEYHTEDRKINKNVYFGLFLAFALFFIATVWLYILYLK